METKVNELPLWNKIQAPDYVVLSATANKDGDVFYIIKDNKITAIKMVDVWHNCRYCYGNFIGADGTEYNNAKLGGNKYQDNSKNGFTFYFKQGFANAYSSVEDARNGIPMKEKRLSEMLVAPFGEDGEPESLINNGSDEDVIAYGYGLKQDKSVYFNWKRFNKFAVVATEFGDLITFIKSNLNGKLERVWLKEGTFFCNRQLAEHHAKWQLSEMNVVDFPKEVKSENAKRTATIMVGTLKISDFTFDNPSRLVKLCNEIAQLILDNENE